MRTTRIYIITYGKIFTYEHGKYVYYYSSVNVHIANTLLEIIIRLTLLPNVNARNIPFVVIIKPFNLKNILLPYVSSNEMIHFDQLSMIINRELTIHESIYFYSSFIWIRYSKILWDTTKKRFSSFEIKDGPIFLFHVENYKWNAINYL